MVTAIIFCKVLIALEAAIVLGALSILQHVCMKGA